MSLAESGGIKLRVASVSLACTAFKLQQMINQNLFELMQRGDLLNTYPKLNIGCKVTRKLKLFINPVTTGLFTPEILKRLLFFT